MNGKPEPAPARPEPWWARLIPDLRGLVIAGYFGLAARLLYMIEGQKELLKDSAFMTLATLIMGSGGLGIVVTYLFGGTKTGSEVMTSQTAQVLRAASSGTGSGAAPTPPGKPAKVEVVNDPANPVPADPAPER